MIHRIIRLAAGFACIFLLSLLTIAAVNPAGETRWCRSSTKAAPSATRT